MSIVSMVDNKVLQVKRDTAIAEARTAGGDPAAIAAAAAGGGGATPGVPSNIANQLTAYVPTEVLTIWVALVAILHDPKPKAGADVCQADWRAHWWLAVGTAALAVLLTVGFAYRKFQDTEGVSFKMPWFAMFAAPVAFLAWAIALPGGPLRSACWYSEEAGAFIVLVTTILIASLAYIVGQGRRFEKV